MKTILGLSAILQSELLGPLGSERYRKCAADIAASAVQIQDLIRTTRTAKATAKTLGITRMPKSLVPLICDTDTALGATELSPPSGTAVRGTAIAELVAYAYRAGVQPDRWLQFLKRLRSFLNAEGAALLVHNRQSNKCRILYMTSEAVRPSSQEAPTASDSLVCKHFIEERVFVPLGSVWTDADILTSKMQHAGDERRREDTNRPYESSHTMAGLIERNGAETTFISVSRFRSSGAFNRDDIAILEELLPPMRKAINHYRKISLSEKMREAFVSLFDRLPLAMALIGSAGQPLHLNRASRELLAAADGLTLGTEGFHAATPHETAALRKAVASALVGSERHSANGGQAISLSRPSGRRPLSVLVISVPPSTICEVGEALGPMAAVFITDPESQRAADDEYLRHFWQLTKTEGRVTKAIASAAGVEQIAKEMGITPNTVRTHLKHIFSKTQTAGQVELARLVLSSPAFVRRD